MITSRHPFSGATLKGTIIPGWLVAAILGNRNLPQMLCKRVLEKQPQVCLPWPKPAKCSEQPLQARGNLLCTAIWVLHLIDRLVHEAPLTYGWATTEPLTGTNDRGILGSLPAGFCVFILDCKASHLALGIHVHAGLPHPLPCFQVLVLSTVTPAEKATGNNIPVGMASCRHQPFLSISFRTRKLIKDSSMVHVQKFSGGWSGCPH